MILRRQFLIGLLCAPAVVPVKALALPSRQMGVLTICTIDPFTKQWRSMSIFSHLPTVKQMRAVEANEAVKAWHWRPNGGWSNWKDRSPNWGWIQDAPQRIAYHKIET